MFTHLDIVFACGLLSLTFLNINHERNKKNDTLQFQAHNG